MLKIRSFTVKSVFSPLHHQCELHGENFYITLVNIVHSYNKNVSWHYLVVILGKTVGGVSPTLPIIKRRKKRTVYLLLIDLVWQALHKNRPTKHTFLQNLCCCYLMIFRMFAFAPFWSADAAHLWSVISASRQWIILRRIKWFSSEMLRFSHLYISRLSTHVHLLIVLNFKPIKNYWLTILKPNDKGLTCKEATFTVPMNWTSSSPLKLSRASSSLSTVR